MNDRLAGKPRRCLTSLALAIGLGASIAFSASAAEFAGAKFPDEMTVAGTQLQLNGLALRTFSIFNVHVYVAGLYVPSRTADADAVITSLAPKALVFHFLHDVDADKARQAWQEGFDDNCAHPCDVRPDLMRKFLEGVIALHKGDSTMLTVQGSHVGLFLNGREIATIDDRPFAVLIMKTFIGPHPPSPRLKSALMGER